MIFDKNSKIGSLNTPNSLEETNKIINQLMQDMKDFEKSVAEKKKNFNVNKSMKTEYEKLRKLAVKYADAAKSFEKDGDKNTATSLWTYAKNYANQAKELKKEINEKLGFTKKTSDAKKQVDKTASLKKDYYKFVDKIETDSQKASLSKDEFEMAQIKKRRDEDLAKVQEYQNKNIITEEQASIEKTKINDRYYNEKKNLEDEIEEKKLKTITENAEKEKKLNEIRLKEERKNIIDSKNQEIDVIDEEIQAVKHKSDIQEISEEDAFNTFQELCEKKKKILEELGKDEKLTSEQRLKFSKEASEIGQQIEKNNFDFEENLFQNQVVKTQALNDAIEKIVQKRILNTANLEFQSINDNRKQIEHNFDLGKISAKEYFGEVDKLSQQELNILKELSENTRLSEEQKLEIKREIAQKEREIEKESFDESIFYIDQKKAYLDLVANAAIDVGRRLKRTDNEVTQSIGEVFSSLAYGVDDINNFFTQFDKLSLLAKDSVESNFSQISLIVSGLEKNAGFFSSIIGESISLLKKVKNGEEVYADTMMKSTGNILKNIPVVGEVLSSISNLFVEGFGSFFGAKTEEELNNLKNVQEQEEKFNLKSAEEQIKIEKLKASWHDDELERIKAEYDAEIYAISQSQDSELLKDALKTNAYKNYEKQKTKYLEQEQKNRDKIVEDAYELEKKSAKDYFDLRIKNAKELIKEEESKLKTIQDEIDSIDEALNKRSEEYQERGEIYQKFQSEKQNSLGSLSPEFFRTPIEKFELDTDNEKSNVENLFDSGLITEEEKTNKLADIALRKNIFYSNIAKNLVKGTKEHVQYQKLVNNSYKEYYDLVTQTSEEELLNEKNLLEQKRNNIQLEVTEKINALATIEEQQRISLANLEERYKTSAGVWRDNFIQANNAWSADIDAKLTDFQNKIKGINNKIGSPETSTSSKSYATSSQTQSYTSPSVTNSNSVKVSTSSLEEKMQKLGVANTKRGRIVVQLAEKAGILDNPLMIYQRYGVLSETALEDEAKKANIPIYHSGGIAEGGLSLLQKGELVLTKQMQENMLGMITNPYNSNTSNNVSINLNGQINASNPNDVLRLTEQIKSEIAKSFRKQI